VPISYHGRTYAEGKQIGWRDGLDALWLLFKFRFLDARATNDPARESLESLARSPQLARWVLEGFGEALGDRVLEAGCGIGNLTTALLDRERIVALDVEPSYVRRLDQRYGHLENFSTVRGDLEDPDLFAKLEDEQFDTVVCVNVLEHLDRPDVALAGFHRVLGSGGRVLILVPAHRSLHSAMDDAVRHRTRFERDELVELLDGSGFEIERISPFNRLGVLGWSVNRWIGRDRIGRGQVSAFRLMLPLARRLERIEGLRGLSWIAVARKPA
jgi:SAM-dependent methyltransferase